MTNLSVASDAAGHVVGGRGEEGLFFWGGVVGEGEGEGKEREGFLRLSFLISQLSFQLDGDGRRQKVRARTCSDPAAFPDLSRSPLRRRVEQTYRSATLIGKAEKSDSDRRRAVDENSKTIVFSTRDAGETNGPVACETSPSGGFSRRPGPPPWISSSFASRDQAH